MILVDMLWGWPISVGVVWLLGIAIGILMCEGD